MKRTSNEEVLAMMWTATASTRWYGSPIFDYAYAKQATRVMPGDWDSSKVVEIKASYAGQSNQMEATVLSAWGAAVSGSWQRTSKSEIDNFLEELKEDLGWWKTKEGRASERNAVCAHSLLSAKEQNDRTEKQIETWFDTWIDSGWLATDELKTLALLRALHFSCEPAVKRLGQSLRDINKEFGSGDLALRAEGKLLLEQENPAFVYKTKDGRGNGEKRGSFKRKVSHFIESVDTLKALESVGLNLTMEEVQELMSRDSSCFITGGRNAMMDHLSKQYVAKRKEENPQATLWPILSKEQSVADISRAMGSVKWVDLVGPKGENVLHLLAKSSPSAFAKYAATPKGKVLAESKNKEGVTPWEVLLTGYGLDVMGKILGKVAPQKKLNWGEVMHLAVKRNSWSAMKEFRPNPSQKEKDNLVLLESIFNETQKERAAWLKTEKGQELVRLVDKQFGGEVAEGGRHGNQNELNFLAGWVVSPEVEFQSGSWRHPWEKVATTKVEWKLHIKESLKEIAKVWQYDKTQKEKAKRKMGEVFDLAMQHGISFKGLERELNQIGKTDWVKKLEEYGWSECITKEEACELKVRAGLPKTEEVAVKTRKGVL
jgi:hypothetical protein